MKKLRKWFNGQWQPVSENDPLVEYAVEHTLDDNDTVISETIFVAKSPAESADLKA